MNVVWNLKAQFETVQHTSVFDCYIAECLLSEGRYAVTQEETLIRYQCHTLEELADQQKRALVANTKLNSLFYDIEMPLISILYHMEKKGILLDADKLHQIGEEITTEITKLTASLQKDLSPEINLNSATQLGNYLVEKEGVPLGRTKTGKYATNESELIKHKGQFPVIQDLLAYRELSKLKSTYIDSLIQKIADDKRIHTTYTQAGISTGRLASSNPNLQNIPVTSLFGKKIKSCFVAAPNCTLVSFDYSQQELRILAHLTQEDKLIDAFNNNLDVHMLTASQLFKTPYDKVTKEQRAVGKTINFGIIYGMGGFGLSEALQIPVSEAEQFIRNFYITFPKIKSFYDHYLKEGMKNNFVETLLGRRRYVFLNPRQTFLDNQTRRILLNFPIQGTAADLMKKAMVDIDREVLQKNTEISLLLQIHDDLVFETQNADKEKRDATIEQIKQIMCEVYALTVPMDVSVKIGREWGKVDPETENN